MKTGAIMAAEVNYEQSGIWAFTGYPITQAEGDALRSLGGAHRCYLSDPVHLDCISPDLSELTGYTMDDLLDERGLGIYTKMMHPDDHEKFGVFCEELAREECCKTVSYRIVKKDGSVIAVNDTL